jgi:flagellar hook protein FlgE
MGSFSTAVSGLQAAQQQLQNVSNNLANIDTNGYKDQQLTFADVFSRTGVTNGSGDPLQTGSGVTVEATDSNFSEGSVNATGIASNMAISGNGFFVTQGSDGSYDFTRAGNFTTNKEGQITTPSGELVLGYPAANGIVNTAAALQPLEVGTGISTPAVASTTMQISANLDASQPVGATASSSLPIYDSLGTSHTLSVTYTKTASDTWSYSVTMPGADLSPAGATNTPVATGTLNFNSSGELVSTEPTGGTTTIAPSQGIAITLPPTGTPQAAFADGAAPVALNWVLETGTTPTITQTATASSTSATTTDGFASGVLSSYTVQSDGTILGDFTSGQTLALGQVAVASFANIEGLADVGNNNYNVTASSGPSVIGLADAGGRGTIIGGSVEASNVNIATEFANLIVAQQAYSANAKSITTFNTVSQATLAMLQ